MYRTQHLFTSDTKISSCIGHNTFLHRTPRLALVSDKTPPTQEQCQRFFTSHLYFINSVIKLTEYSTQLTRTDEVATQVQHVRVLVSLSFLSYLSFPPFASLPADGVSLTWPEKDSEAVVGLFGFLSSPVSFTNSVTVHEDGGLTLSVSITCTRAILPNHTGHWLHIDAE